MRLYLNSTRGLLMGPLWLLSAGAASGAVHRSGMGPRMPHEKFCRAKEVSLFIPRTTERRLGADLLGLRFFSDFELLDRASGSEGGWPIAFSESSDNALQSASTSGTGAIQIMMRREAFEIANIYVPVKCRWTLDPEVVRQIGSKTLGLMEVFGPLVQSFLNKPTCLFARLRGPRFGLAITTSHEPRLTFLRRLGSTRRTRQRPEWLAEYRARQQPESG
jgi:hypothetical protein